jgi:meiotically up-regulated gene 157 (Mug157) protein
MKDCKALRRHIQRLVEKIDRSDVRDMFQNCFFSTLDTTLEKLGNGTVYIFTGDIEAMWLRDSAAQVLHYLPFCGIDPELKEIVKGLIRRQAQYVLIDPYANAFNKSANGARLHNDLPPQGPWVWEQKYELDSLCYFFQLALQYFACTDDASIFDAEFMRAAARILDVFEIEQNHDRDSRYSFVRNGGEHAHDSLERDGKGTPTVYTGMVWSAFRPSDDRCDYHYLVPANCFAATVLRKMTDIFHMLARPELAARAQRLAQDIQDGIQKHAVFKHDVFGEIYVYETDGNGGRVLMDDANVPSLLSLPLLGWCEPDDPLYKNTRRFCLSNANPYYFEGNAAKGIGSPHTPDGYIWHIALIVEGLTSRDEEEKERILKCLTATHAGEYRMHESFYKNEPAAYTRKWFGWADSLFAQFIMQYYRLV